jgi:hypothetical protein
MAPGHKKTERPSPRATSPGRVLGVAMKHLTEVDLEEDHLLARERQTAMMEQPCLAQHNHVLCV